MNKNASCFNLLVGIESKNARKYVKFASEENIFKPFLTYAFNPLAWEYHNPKILIGKLSRMIYHVKKHPKIFLMLFYLLRIT